MLLPANNEPPGWRDSLRYILDFFYYIIRVWVRWWWLYLLFILIVCGIIMYLIGIGYNIDLIKQLFLGLYIFIITLLCIPRFFKECQNGAGTSCVCIVFMSLLTAAMFLWSLFGFWGAICALMAGQTWMFLIVSGFRNAEFRKLIARDLRLQQQQADAINPSEIDDEVLRSITIKRKNQYQINRYWLEITVPFCWFCTGIFGLNLLLDYLGVGFDLNDMQLLKTVGSTIITEKLLIIHWIKRFGDRYVGYYDQYGRQLGLE